ncbi:MAG: TVP38/TMEM64 family protein [Halomonas sp.]|uniref:TVP38/TMEM64 family protein n=1 Tax=Halomonas sp. TaxID=1486246 RepID=UPI003F8FB9B2
MFRPFGLILVVLTLLLGLGLLWQWLAMQDLMNVENLLALAHHSLGWTDSPWAVLVVMGLYAAASLVMFPLSLMVALTGLLFGPWWGFGYALAGTLSASVLNWWVGHLIGREALMHHGGQRLRELARYLSGRGIRTMVIINLLPLAPFTLTNMMAGAFRLRFRDYMIGSTLGIAPGLAAVTLLGSQLGELATAQSHREIVLATLGLAAGMAMLWFLKRWAVHRKN